MGSKPKYDRTFVEDHLSQYGYKLKSEYKTAGTPMLVECANGHIYQTRFQNFYHRKTRCKVCQGLGNYNTKEELIRKLKENNCEYVDHYRDPKIKRTIVKYICSCGGLGESRIDRFLLGERCTECYAERMRTSRKKGKLERMEKLISKSSKEEQ
ncbi:hypothetical protein [Aneurinibacillus migulanus]|uniref:hypothetical protein n=1 Tax=Aneurinibacillus migulanus TaxID=47500 RepID=UPI0020A0ECE9|nr:hypothetical protein [Aneurinibacillus migulanus]MCP1357741.1 hypothetical protein [Aneurinibacillus migulanus]